MPTMTVTITNVPTFAVVNTGYKFTGVMNLPEVVKGPIKINSMSLYYGRGRTYRVGPYLKVKCGDTEFRTDYFTISETGTSSAKERTLNIIGAITVGDDHLLKVNGRTITFTASHDTSDGKLIDRPYAGNMTLTVNYTLLFEPSKITAPESVTMGDTLTVTVPDNGLNEGFEHTATLVLGSQSVSGVVTGPGEIALTVPRTTAWLSEVPDTVTGEATLTLTTAGADQTGETTQTVNLLIPDDVLPTLTGISVVRIDGRVPSEWGLYLKGESAATLTIEGAKAGEGSEIAGYRIEGAGFAGDADVLTTGKLPTAGAVPFRATVTDRRGRSGAMTVELNVVDYSVPSLSSLTVERCDQYGTPTDDGVYLMGTAEYQVTPVETNKAVFKVYANDVLATPISENAIGKYTFMLDGQYDTSRGYDIKVVVFDAVTVGSNAPASLTDRVPTATVGYDLMWDETVGDYGVSFGRYTQNTKRLSIPEDWRFIRGEVDIEQKADEAKQAASEASEAVGGKLGKTDTAADSLKLGGVAASEYALKSELGASGVVLETLWTNKSPASTFAAQTIALDLTDCAAVLITARRSTSLASEASFLYPADGVQRFLSVPGNTINYRYVTVNSNGVVFGDGRWYSSYQANGSTTDNGNVLPQVIYGLKGVRT